MPLVDGIAVEDAVVGDEAAAALRQEDLVAELDRALRLAALEQIGVRLEDREELLVHRDLFALEHAAAGLRDDPVGQAREVLDLAAHAGDEGGAQQITGRGRAGRGDRGARRRHDARGDAEEIAVLAPLLARALRGRQAADLLHAAPRPAGAVGEPAPRARHVRRRAAVTSRVRTRTASQSRVLSVGKWISVSTTVVSTRSWAPSSRPSVTAAWTTASLRARTVAGVRRQKGAVEGVVLGHGLGVEGREAPQRVAVGDALAQFAEIPGLDALEHEGAQDLGGAQAVAPRPGAPEPAHQIGVDERDELLLRVEKVGEGLHGRLQRDPLGLQFEIGKAEGAGPRPHRARRRWAIRNARCAADIAWISSLRRWHSATHAATSSRQAMGMYSVQVFCCSFQVNSAVSCRGPSVAHRHVGRPHRLVLRVRDPSRKGPIVRSRARSRWPAGLVASGRVMGIVYILSNISSTKNVTVTRARLGNVPRLGGRALGAVAPHRLRGTMLRGCERGSPRFWRRSRRRGL